MGSDKPSKTDEERAERIAADICFGKFKYGDHLHHVMGCMIHVYVGGRCTMCNKLMPVETSTGNLPTPPRADRLAETKG